jgi:hypothetical protein
MARQCLLGGWLAALVLAFAAPAAWAWNAAGHRLAAVIAWEQLSLPVQAEAQRLLQFHPAAGEWRTKLGDDDKVLLFAEASTWPDELRRRSVDPASIGRADTATGGDWHYLNWPIGRPRGAALRGQLDRQIARLSLAVADHTRPDRERAEALAWLLHLVADAHQPLHVATRLNEGQAYEPADDAGGNGFAVFDPANPRIQETNLHRFWDDLPGPPWLRGNRLKNIAAALAASHPAATIPLGDVDAWLGESHQLAAAVVYPKSAPFTIDDAYRIRARKLADQRIAVAGVRLGIWLDRLLQR